MIVTPETYPCRAPGGNRIAFLPESLDQQEPTCQLPSLSDQGVHWEICSAIWRFTLLVTRSLPFIKSGFISTTIAASCDQETSFWAALRELESIQKFKSGVNDVCCMFAEPPCTAASPEHSRLSQLISGVIFQHKDRQTSNRKRQHRLGAPVLGFEFRFG